MRDWIGANLVFLMIALAAALLLFFGVTAVRALNLGDTAERIVSVAVGFAAVSLSILAVRWLLTPRASRR